MQPKITLIALHTANTRTYTLTHTGRVDQKAKNSTANGHQADQDAEGGGTGAGEGS